MHWKDFLLLLMVSLGKLESKLPRTSRGWATDSMLRVSQQELIVVFAATGAVVTFQWHLSLSASSLGHKATK